jgi:hypothetical protein
MDHDAAIELASRAVDEPLTQDLERELALHLVACPDCKRFYDTSSSVRSALRSRAQAEAPAAVVDRAALRAVTVLRGGADPGPHAPVEEPAAAEAPLVTEQAEAHAPEALPAQAGPEAPRVSRRERRTVDRESRGALPRRGWWIAALVGTVALAAVAVFVVTSGGVLDRVRVGLPSAGTVRQKVLSALDGANSVQASWTSTRLGLYRRPGEAKIVYAFTNATETGRVTFSDPASLREERTLSVPGQPDSHTAFVAQGTQLVTKLEEPERREAVVVSNAAPGPPEEPQRGRLGALEPTFGSVARLVATARDVRVEGRGTLRGRRGWRVVLRVPADELTRADRIDVLLDSKSFVPIRVERFISRRHAEILGPPELLSEAAIDAQFAGRDRIVSELATMDRLRIDGDVPSDAFLLPPPDGVTPENRDDKWETVDRSLIESKLPFKPLLPTGLPSGFREAGFAVSTARPLLWGPRRSFPAADGALQVVYTDGATTIVLSERRVSRGRERITGSPLAGALPVSVRPAGAGGLEFGISSEVPPHVFGFIGDLYVMASGFVPERDLEALLSSIEPEATAAPSSSSPSASPSASPSTQSLSPAPSATASVVASSPPASARPSPSAPGSPRP